MRRNLGVESRAGSYPFRVNERHQSARRFVRDGEVPVVVVNRRDPAVEGGAAPVNRLALAESALGAEQALRQRCERSLQEAQASLRELQTKIGHALLARDEALEANRVLAAENERLRAELAALRAEDEGEQAPPRLPKPQRPRLSSRRLARRPAKEPKPVKWW